MACMPKYLIIIYQRASPLAYLVRYDGDKEKYVARCITDMSNVGEGDHLFAAIDDLEKNLAKVAEGNKAVTPQMMI